MIDPISAVSSAVVAVAGAIKADLRLDLELAKGDEGYRKALVKERIAQKEFWKPLQDLLIKLGNSVKLDG